MSIRILALAGIALFATACGVHTRVAVHNGGDAAADFTVTSADGGDAVTFERVAPGTTSAFQRASFDDYHGVGVAGGDAEAEVDLVPEQDNTVHVEGGEARVEASYNPENEFW